MNVACASALVTGSASGLGAATARRLHADGAHVVLLDLPATQDTASEGGVAAMTLPAARELARSMVRVVTIAPGLFDTPMFAGVTPGVRRSVEAQVPHPSRLGRPAEYAALVAHLVADPMLDGEVVRLDGGIRTGAR